jgi:hypothetical protein
MDYQLVYAETIKITDTKSGIEVLINGKHKANFVEQSNITKLYRQNSQNCITKLTGGTYFFINKQLVDHRDSLYKGYIMSDSVLDEVMNIVGYSSNLSKKDLKGLHLVTTGRSDYTLVKYYKSRGMNGGSIGLYWVWSPFSGCIRYAYKIVTDEGEVISNKHFDIGRVAIDDYFYDELLDSSSEFLDYIIKEIEKRFRSMAKEYCSVSDMLTINTFANERNVIDIAEETTFDHVSSIYKPEIIGTDFAKTAQSHISKLVAWKYAVELIQYDETVGDGNLYAVVNRTLWD